ncbi:MAG: DNA polymerase III subunit alpha [Candidatus Dormibacteria bacterium]
MTFAELAARSHYSFLEGSASPRALARRAAALDIAAVGLCDRSGLYGAVEFTQAAEAAGIKPLIGAELELIDGSRLRLLARTHEGYRQLCRAVSAAQLAGVKGQPRIRLSGLEERVLPPRSSSRRRLTVPPPTRPRALRPTAGPFPEGWPGLPSATPLATGEPACVDASQLNGCIAIAGGPQSALVDALVRGDRRAALRYAERLRECFGKDRAAILLTHHLHPADQWIAAECADIAQRLELPLVVSATPVHATTHDKPLLDVLTAIRHRTTLDAAAAHGLLLPNSEHRLHDEATLRARLSAYPGAFDTAAHIAAECSVSLDFSDVRFPGYRVPNGETPFSVLYALCQDAVQRKYHPMTRQVAARLQRELDVIEKTGLAEFFLITWDIMRFAREHGIPGQGRGSAADSIVAYLLGITRVDPVAHDLLFERFLHEDHQGTPDIDIDFSTDHREHVLQYVYDKYGADRTGMVANVVTFRPRMAIRQVGAAMGFPETILDNLATGADGWYMANLEETLSAGGIAIKAADVVNRNHLQEERVTATSPTTSSLPWRQFIDVLKRIEGTPRHLSIHVGGMLVTGEPLIDVVPVERATMPGRVVVQFDKDDVEDLGLIKMDLLGLRTLSAIAECLELIDHTTGSRPDLDALPLDDARVYDMICRVDTIGLFQIESRAQQQSLWQSQPREFNDLIVQVAIIRPGPIQGDAVHPYLRRRQGLEPVTYPHPKLEPILKETRGVILYQEQILRIVMDVAGYTAGEADRFRRAMNRHRSRLEMEELRDDFIRRCVDHELDRPVAEQIFRSVAGFAEFGFCKSHAAAFARTAYETAWLRLEYPAHWLCALLNAQPMGFYAPSVLVDDARRHGVQVLPVDVTRSRARCTIEQVSDKSSRGAEHLSALLRQSSAGDESSPACGTRRGQVSRPSAAHSPRFGVRLSFAYVRGLGPAARAACEDAVAAGANTSIEAFWRHTLLPRRAMENLVKIGAFDTVGDGVPRRELLWRLKEIEESLPPRLRPQRAVEEKKGEDMHSRRVPQASAARRGLSEEADACPPPSSTNSGGAFGPPRGAGAIAGSRFGDAPQQPRDVRNDPAAPLVDLPAPPPQLPPMTERERVTTEYALTQVSTGPHLVSFIRTQLDALGCLPLARAREQADGTRVRIAGLVITRQAPMSASGFRFFTLSDEHANLDIVFRPAVAQRTRDVARQPLLMVDGTLQVESGRINVLVEHVTALDGDGRPLLRGAPSSNVPAPRAHNFR